MKPLPRFVSGPVRESLWVFSPSLRSQNREFREDSGILSTTPDPARRSGHAIRAPKGFLEKVEKHFRKILLKGWNEV